MLLPLCRRCFVPNSGQHATCWRCGIKLVTEVEPTLDPQVAPSAAVVAYAAGGNTLRSTTPGTPQHDPNPQVLRQCGTDTYDVVDVPR